MYRARRGRKNRGVIHRGRGSEGRSDEKPEHADWRRMTDCLSMEDADYRDS